MTAVPYSYEFSGFRVEPSRRRVHGPDGEVLRLSSRAYDVLIHLLEQRHRIVSKAELMQTVWLNVVVEENNLGQAISSLRRAFGDSREASNVIATVPGRGYRFVGCVEVEFEPAQPDALTGRGRGPPGVVDPLPEAPSVAALPFVNLCNDPLQDYFVDGVMQEILTSLSRVRSLLVIAGSATMTMKNQVVDPRAAARRLGVGYILQGSVRRAGSKVRIAVSLTDRKTGQQIWADRFEDTLEDVFALQDRVALSVAGAIEPNIAAAELRRIGQRPAESLSCYDRLLRASHLRASLSKPDVLLALDILEQALELAPDYAPALAQAAGCHSQIYLNRWVDDFEAHRTQGLITAERAEQAGGRDASVLTHVANALIDLDDCQSRNSMNRALTLIDRAIAINPGSAYTWFISGILRLINGSGTLAIEHLHRAVRLDPISTLAQAARAHIGVARAVEGNYEDALQSLETTGYRTPRIRLVLVSLYTELGQLEQAREELRAYQQLGIVPAETMVLHMSRSAPVQAWMQAMLARADTDVA